MMWQLEIIATSEIFRFVGCISINNIAYLEDAVYLNLIIS